MKYCTNCGKQNGDEDKFCESCGAALGDDVAQETAANADTGAEAKEQTAEPAAAPTGVKGKIVGVRNKAATFEKKHSIIVNAITMVCAIVIMFVALFAPIKVMAYTQRYIHDDLLDANSDYHYVEINQTVWDMIGAIGYFSLDAKDPDDAKKIAEIQKEYMEAVSKPALDEDTYADNLSDVNYLAYVLAVTGGAGFSELFMGVGGAAFITAVFALIVTILAFVIAIISLVYLIYAIIGMVKKKTTKNPFKYLGTMLGLSGSAITLLAVAPMTKVGGGMFAIMLFAAIIMLVLGAGSSLIMGKSGLALTIKKSAISLVLLIATCLLFTNAVELVGDPSSLNVPYGYGLFGIFSMIGAANANAMASAIGPAAIAMFACSFVAAAVKALESSLKSLAGVAKAKEEKYIFSNSILAIVMMVIAIVFAFVGEPYIIGAITGTPASAIEPNALLRAQVYVSAVFLLAVAITQKAFKPQNKPMFDAPSSEPATANGAPAPEANAEHVTSVEDVAEPVVDETAEQSVAKNEDLKDL